MVIFLTILTFNVNGIRDDQKRKSVFESLSVQNADILLIQETHSTPDIETKWQKEWKWGKSLWNSGSSNSRGVAILFKTKLQNIEFYNVNWDSEGRVLSVDIEIFKEKVHVVNIYAPCRTNPNIQDAFYDNIYRFVHSQHQTILGGDTNCVHQIQRDRTTITKRPRREYVSESLNELIECFGLEDSVEFDPNFIQMFTWRNNLVQARLDRIYVSTQKSKVQNIKCTPSVYSDHDMFSVQLQINIKETEKGRGYWKNNVQIYEDKEYLNELKTLWGKWKSLLVLFRSKAEWWNATKQRIKELNIRFAVAMSKSRKNEYEMELQQLQILKDKLDKGERVLTRFNQVKRNLVKMQKKNMEKLKVQDMAEYYDKNEKCDKYFFRRFKEKQKNCVIEKLKDEENTEQETLGEKMQIVTKFYQDLYKKLPHNDYQTLFLDKITPERRIAQYEAENLQRNIQTDELISTIKGFKENKCPGPDGLSIEFYVKCWDIIKIEFVEVVQEIFNNNNMPEDMKMGYTTLIFKKGEKNDITNYRPISLLNTDYKIITKLLANRFKLILSEIIDPCQTAVPNRKISDSLRIIRDICAQEQVKKTDSMILSIDFQKAFDSVSLDYLFSVLKKFGIKDEMLSFLKSMYSNSYNRIILNGYLSQKIAIERGVRQGDPLSLFMFIIAIEPLITSINEDQRIKGIITPGNKEIKVVGFADDLTLILNKEDSLFASLELLRRHELVTGMKLNKRKTKLLRLAVSKKFFINKTDIEEVEHLEILGVKFGNFDMATENWTICLASAKKETDKLKNIKVSLEGKCLLVKVKILPKFLYLSKIFPMPKSIAKKVNSMVEQFVFYKNSKLKIETICKPKKLGGYDILNIPYFTMCMYIMCVYDYFCVRQGILNTIDGIVLNFIEYNIGQQLSVFLGINAKNNLLHKLTPMKYYKDVIDFIRTHNITSADIKLGKHRYLYDKIVSNIQGERLILLKPVNMVNACENMHNKILSNHIKTFNFKIMWGILPVKTQTNIMRIAGDNKCVLCNDNEPEFISHLFWKCKFARRIYEFIYVTILNATSCHFMEDYKSCILLDLSGPEYTKASQWDIRIITLLISVARYKIWLERNDVIFNSQTQNSERVIARIKSSLNARKNIEKLRNPPKYEKETQFLCSKFP